jgi:hypothetical protein
VNVALGVFASVFLAVKVRRWKLGGRARLFGGRTDPAG